MSFLGALGDGKFSFFFIDPNDYPTILATTWPELTTRYWIEDMDTSPQIYRFTPLGYVRALQLSGRSNERQFREDLGKLCKVLKGSLQDRSTPSFISFHNLVAESGVTEAFAQNALDADLIGEILGKTGAKWEGEHLVRVPANFGLGPL